MARKVISNCEFYVNGAKVEYFKSVTEDAREIRKAVKLMGGKVAFMDSDPDKVVRINYVKPKSNPIDWAGFEDGTIAIVVPNGPRVTFSPCCTLNVGEYTIDNDNETVQPITFGYEDRKES